MRDAADRAHARAARPPRTTLPAQTAAAPFFGRLSARGKSVMKEQMVKVRIGLHEESGVELEIFTRQLLALRIMGQSERARTSLLTREQAIRLRAALDEMIRELDAATPEDQAARLRAA
jgi:hypothetical protein